MQHGGAARAAIQAAPTPGFLVGADAHIGPPASVCNGRFGRKKTPAGGRGWGDEPYCMKVPSIICWMYSWYRSCFSAGTRSLTAPADSAPFCMVP